MAGKKKKRKKTRKKKGCGKFKLKITPMTSEGTRVKVANTSYPFQSSQNHEYVLSWVRERGQGKKKRRK